MSQSNVQAAAGAALPDTYNAWQIFGAGFENVGRGGKPVTLPLREPAPNEILIRVDALGLCQSDIKIINQGNKHARLQGRDLATDPTVLGHECAATVVRVGEQWAGQFSPGDRYVVQADIYYKGFNYAFGYLIPGGLAQFSYLDERALDGDEGCYLLPVQPSTGYSESALAEPWACVEMSYNVQERVAPKDGAALLVTDEPERWREAFPKAQIAPRSLEGLAEDALFDDIAVPEPSAALVQALAPRLRDHGVMYLLGRPADDGVVDLDIGRIHYKGVRFFGGADSLEGLQRVHSRYDLSPGGDAFFSGAGGPMGQMHVQRAVEISNGPRRVVVTDLDRGRMDHIQDRFGSLARDKGVELITLTPGEFDSQEAMDRHIQGLVPGGFSDIIIMAPVAGLVSSSLTFAADHALVNIFAGVGVGSTAGVALRDLCRGAQLFGTSGSRISDMRKVLSMVEAGELNTNLSVAAIGGLNAAKEGLEGVRDARFPGKTVIYPQIPDLPLLTLDEIPKRIPELKDKLGPKNTWTKEAEQALLELLA